MRKIALVALALLLMASPAFATKKPKATHPPVVKHQMDKSKLGKHAKPHHPKAMHATNKHPRAVHPKNPHLNEVKPHRANTKNTNKAALKASNKGKHKHKFHIF